MMRKTAVAFRIFERENSEGVLVLGAPNLPEDQHANAYYDGGPNSINPGVGAAALSADSAPFFVLGKG